MGRWTRTLLPTHKMLLRPKQCFVRQEKLLQQKEIQAQPYNQKGKPLFPILLGQPIWMKLPDDTKRSLCTCIKMVPNHSYEAEVAGRCYCQNRHHLRTTVLELSSNKEVTDICLSFISYFHHWIPLPLHTALNKTSVEKNPLNIFLIYT